MAQDTEVQVKALSMPSDIWAEVDQQADEWRANRSAAWLRIYQEWKQYRAAQPQFNPSAPKNYKIITSEKAQKC